jgi:hypothetical protein
MTRCLSVIVAVIVLSIAVLSALGQSPSSGYQPGTIMAVTVHQNSGKSDASVTQYDVSVKVGNTIYVILFTPLNGSNTVTYAAGDELLVLVGSKTIAFNSPVAGKIELPILRLETATPLNNPSKAPGQDVAVKLSLTAAQQTEIEPILDQEAGQVRELCANAELSRTDKLRKYDDIVQATDEQITPLLSGPQLKKLHDLRKGQKQDLKRRIAEGKSSNQTQN